MGYEETRDSQSLRADRVQGYPSKSEKPPELGVLPRLLNDLLSAQDNAVRLRERLMKLSSAVFGENAATDRPQEIKAEPERDPAATVSRLQESVRELAREFDVLHSIAGKLEKLV